LLIPLDLFAPFRRRSTGGDVLNDIARFSYDAAQHQSGQLRSGTEAGFRVQFGAGIPLARNDLLQ
jgi:hypothetical protein